MTSADTERFVRAFIRKEKRDRWLTLLGSEKGRARLTRTFDHDYDFDPRWAEHLESEDSAGAVLKRLRNAGAGTTCDLLSADRDLDGVKMNLEEALERVVWSGFGTYIVCIPDRLVYFESEDKGQRFLLRQTETV